MLSGLIQNTLIDSLCILQLCFCEPIAPESLKTDTSIAFHTQADPFQLTNHSPPPLALNISTATVTAVRRHPMVASDISLP